jgi:RHS repeat-associated protein
VRRVFYGLDVIHERHTDNTVKAQLVRDGNIGGILSRTTAAGHDYYHYDRSGNVTALTDASGVAVAQYAYNAYGGTVLLTLTGTRGVDNPYRYSIKELHSPSGLYDYGYRFYSHSMGRWINRDPIQEEGGVNLYAMVGNSPTNAIDVYGLNPYEDK